MAKTVPFSEARARLSELLDDVEQVHEHVIVTRNGRPSAVLLSAEEYEAIEETLEILSDPDALEALREAEEDVRAGRVRPWEDIKRELGLA
jgi:prevent-host-death family protein